MVCTTTQPQDAVTHQIWDFYLKEYGRYAADSIQILETKSDVKVNAKMKNLFFFVALRPKSTAMVIAGRSVHLTILFPGQA